MAIRREKILIGLSYLVSVALNGMVKED